MRRTWLPTADHRLTLVTLCALAALGRLLGLDRAEFKTDEVWALERTAHLLAGNLVTTGIPSSVGLPNPPAFVYLLALPLLLDRHPLVATAFIALLNTLAVALTATLTRRLADPTVALVATTLYAVSPTAIVYSRKIWAQDALPVFLLGALLLLWQAIAQNRPWSLLPALGLFALAVQLHPTALALGPLFLLGPALQPPRRRWLAPLTLGAGLSALGFLPYLWTLAQTTTPALTTPPDLTLQPLTLLRPWLVATGLPYADLASLSPAGPLVWAWRLVQALLLALLALGAGLLAHEWLTVRTARAAFLLGWLLLPGLFLSLLPLPFQPHYAISLLPAPFLIIALALTWLASRTRLGWLAWAGLGTATALALGLFVSFLAALADGRATPLYGVPLQIHLQARQAAQNLAASLGSPLYTLARDDTWRVQAYLAGSPRRLADATRLLPLPASGPAVYLVMDPQAPAAAWLAAHGSPQPAAAWPATTSGPVQVLVLPAAPPAGEQTVPDGRFTNGLRLLGYRARLADNTLHLDLYWQVEETGQTTVPHVFNHLVSPTGERLAQADGPLAAPADWAPGDRLLTPFAIPWPGTAAGPLTVRTGLYTYPGLERLRLTDGREWVALGPFAPGKEPRR